MQRNDSAIPIKHVQGELVDPRQQVASIRALDSLTHSLAQHNGVLARLLQPKEQRIIAEQLKERIRSATVEDAIDKVTSEANKRCEEIELMAQSQRHQLLLDQNVRMGQLKSQEQEVVSHEIVQLALAERADQLELTGSRLLPADREMLSQLFKQRTIVEMLSIAQTHGVDLKSQTSCHTSPDSGETSWDE
jgi:hypothetical protein